MEIVRSLGEIVQVSIQVSMNAGPGRGEKVCVRREVQ